MSHPSCTSSRKIVFIIIWKVAGELVNLKNITVGSNSPLLVMKATFHSSPRHMWTLLYPQRMLNFVNNARARALLISWGINGSGYVFRTVY